MRKVILGILLLFGVVVIGFVVKERLSSSNQNIPVDTPKAYEANSANEQKIEFKGQLYLYSYFIVEDMEKLILIPNYSEKETVSEITEKYSCRKLINAGFYTRESTPVGFFISDGETLKSWVTNATFNALLSINDLATPRITRTVPMDKLTIALQTGPLLIENASLVKLNIKNDKAARRSVVAVTGSNQLLFMIIHSPTQMYEGPFLVDLPAIVNSIGSTNHLNIADAVNLDGGTASAYIANGEKLSEMVSVGSVFCLR